MGEDLSSQIFKNLNQEGSDELLDIWRGNNRQEWSDVAFEVISEILQARSVDLPPQADPIIEYQKEERYGKKSTIDEIIKNGNEPVFYKPHQVLWLEKWLKRAANMAVILLGLMSMLNIAQIVSNYWPELRNPSMIVSLLESSAIILINFVVLGSVYYFGLKGLAAILKIMMQIEFNSRGVETVKPANP